ncbi:hypothetical protein D1BOALGB6SA_2331 [Olavius sp. associated proteobacterium Delta 1]|nr:hypothetical protein D1BOALGB6SA_2331 [Olavius sp. associated proteobacterium Delta 1]
MSESRGSPSFKASKGEAVPPGRDRGPLATQKMVRFKDGDAYDVEITDYHKG